jgi:single-strand DNA-binding protein
MSENSVTIIGNLTDDPELRYTPSGAAVANCSVAVNKRVNKDGQWEDKLEGFFEITCWRELAENVSQLHKGTRVIIVGRLQQSTWETQEGQKRSKVQILADEIGPSIRWATAEVHRKERSDEGGF